jgi:hypothetical protein
VHFIVSIWHAGSIQQSVGTVEGIDRRKAERASGS